MDKDLKNRIAELNIEDYIWIIYLLIIILSFYSNHLERRYFLTKDAFSKNKYQRIIIIIFSILIVVYIYFLQDSFKSLLNLKPNDSPKKKNLVYLSFLASLLIAVSGFIYLYISVTDNDLDVELAFN